MKFSNVEMGMKLTVFIMAFFFCLPVFGQEKKADKKAVEKKQEKSPTQERLKRLLSTITAQVKKQADSTVSQSDNIEIDGLIIDQTLTKIGHEFYEYFYTQWEAPEKIRDYTIFITEKITMLSTSQIWIDVNDMTIYQQLLKPRSEEIEKAVKIAIRTTLQFLHQYDQDKKQLAGEDMAGSGIY